MSDPKEQQREPDELELDHEIVRDLEPDSSTAGEIRGGRCTAVANGGGNTPLVQSQTL